jgi:HEAT repeat protein
VAAKNIRFLCMHVIGRKVIALFPGGVVPARALEWVTAVASLVERAGTRAMALSVRFERSGVVKQTARPPSKHAGFLRLLLVLSSAVFLCLTACDKPHSLSLLDELEDPRWQVRATAAEALGHRPEIDAVDRLIETLEDPSSAVRMAAALSLGRLDAKEAREPLIWRLRKEKSSTAKVHALFALGAVGETSDAALVMELLNDDARRVRRAASRVLWQVADRDVTVSTIREGLMDPDLKLRRGAVKLAVELELHELRGWENTLLDDPDDDIRGDAWRQYTRELTVWDIPTLKAGLTDPSERVRRDALIGLEDLRVLHLRDEIAELMVTDPASKVRSQAAKTLRTLDGTPGHVVPALWHIEDVADQVTVDEKGAASLHRRLTVVVDRTATPLDSVPLMLPMAFSRVSSVRVGGEESEIDLELYKGVRALEVDLLPLDSGESQVVEIEASADQVIYARGGDAFAFYTPGPMPAEVARLQVTLDAGAGAVDFKAESLSREAVDDIEISAPTDPPPTATTRHYRLWSDLGWIAAIAIPFGVVLVGGCVRARRRRGYDADPLILTGILLAGLFFLLTPQLLEDNLSYYAVARSAVLEGTIDRLDGLTVYNQGVVYAPDARGPQDPLTGVWMHAPAVMAGHALNMALNTPWAPNGFSFPYLYMTALLDFGFVLVGSLAMLAWVRHRVGVEVALPAVLGVVLGTNLLLYVYGWTSSSFQPSFFLVAVFLWAWDRSEGNRGPTHWLLAGVLMGLLATTRTLNLLFVLIPLGEWLWGVLASRERQERPAQLVTLAALGAGFGLGWAPQMWVQMQVDHVFFMDHYGVGSGRFSGLQDNLRGLLLSRSDGDYRGSGLLAAMPIYLGIFAGMPLWLRRAPRMATPMLAVVLLQLLVIGAYEVYWGYHTFATPYLVPATPILCMALAHLLSWCRRRGRVPFLGLLAFGLLASARNAWCFVRHMSDDLIGDWAVDMGDIELVHQLLMLEPKWHDGVLSYSSNFGFLLREAVGALRSGAPAGLLDVTGAYLIAVGPVALISWAWMRRSSWTQPAWLRPPVVLGATLVVASVGLGWLTWISSETNLDRDYHTRKWTERKRELRPKVLAEGKRISWEFSSDSPLEELKLVTFLSGATELAENTQVGLVVVAVDGKKQRIPLLAGTDTADFYIDRPESQLTRGHSTPLEKAAWSYRIHDASSHFYTARAYVRTLPLPPGTRKGRVQVRSTIPQGHLAVAWMQVNEAAVPRRPNRKRWLAERW